MPEMNGHVEIVAGDRTFATGLLIEIVRALGVIADGELLALWGPRGLEDDLRTWSALTGHAIVNTDPRGPIVRWVIRRGAARGQGASTRPLGSRLWLYTNFDCNLRCDYCCVRSSPSAPRRALGLERVSRIAVEAPAVGVREFFVTGGEPFVLSEIAEIVTTLARAAPVTVLTNGMMFTAAPARGTPPAGASSERAPKAFACGSPRACRPIRRRRRSVDFWMPRAFPILTGSSAGLPVAASLRMGSRCRGPI